MLENPDEQGSLSTYLKFSISKIFEKCIIVVSKADNSFLKSFIFFLNSKNLIINYTLSHLFKTLLIFEKYQDNLCI